MGDLKGNRIFSQLRSLSGDGICEYDAVISSLVASLHSNGEHFPILERTGKCIVFYASSEEGFYRGMHSLRGILGQDGEVDYRNRILSFQLGERLISLKGFLAEDPAIREVLGKAYAKYSGMPGQGNSILVKSSDIPALPLNLSALEVFVRFFESFIKGEESASSFADWAFHMHDKGRGVDGGALEEDLSQAGLGSAWRMFAAIAVESGLCPAEDMPFYEASNASIMAKAERAARCLVSGEGTKCFALKTFPGIAMRSCKSRAACRRGGLCLHGKCRSRRLARARFRELLRAGLWDKKADVSLFRGEVDWNAVYEIADQQAVIPQVSDGINTLAPGYGPLENDKLRFASDVMAVEKKNRKMDEFLPKLMKFLTDNGIRPVLMKGQGLSREWSVPSHRNPGDIDLLLSREDYAAARDLLAPKASHVGEEAGEILHQDYQFGSITLELHGTLSTQLSDRVDSVLAHMQEAILSEGGTVTVPIGGYMCPVPSYDYNAAYIFIHLCQHYFFEGVGLRQFCDWAFYLARHRDDTDFSKAVGLVTDAGLEGPWKVLGKMVVDYLGLDPSLMPLYEAGNSARASRAWQYVLKRGNFGVNDNRKERAPEKMIARKFHTFMIYLPFFMRQANIFPAEMMSFFGHFMRKGLKGFQQI